MESLLVSVSEAAKIVGIGKSNAYNLVKHGEWETVSVGKSKKISRAWLLDKYGVKSAQEATNNA